MDFETLTRLVDALPGSEASYPFGPEARVSKVGGKMFALISEDEPLRISLKCDPDLALELRAQYSCVLPGYHLNKQHWNTIEVNAEVPTDELEELVWHSHELVAAKLPKRLRDELPRPQLARPQPPAAD